MHELFHQRIRDLNRVFDLLDRSRHLSSAALYAGCVGLGASISALATGDTLLALIGGCLGLAGAILTYAARRTLRAAHHLYHATSPSWAADSATMHTDT